MSATDVAVITTSPLERNVTKPSSLTVAILSSEVSQVTKPDASAGSAVADN